MSSQSAEPVLYSEDSACQPALPPGCVFPASLTALHPWEVPLLTTHCAVASFFLRPSQLAAIGNLGLREQLHPSGRESLLVRKTASGSEVMSRDTVRKHFITSKVGF